MGRGRQDSPVEYGSNFDAFYTPLLHNHFLKNTYKENVEKGSFKDVHLHKM